MHHTLTNAGSLVCGALLGGLFNQRGKEITSLTGRTLKGRRNDRKAKASDRREGDREGKEEKGVMTRLGLNYPQHESRGGFIGESLHWSQRESADPRPEKAFHFPSGK